MTSGFRINSGGAHLAYGVDPDIAVLAKAIANVFPMAAIVGRAPVMDAAQETLFSSTEASQATGLPLAHQGNRQTDPDWPDWDCANTRRTLVDL